MKFRMSIMTEAYKLFKSYLIVIRKRVVLVECVELLRNCYIRKGAVVGIILSPL